MFASCGPAPTYSRVVGGAAIGGSGGVSGGPAPDTGTDGGTGDASPIGSGGASPAGSGGQPATGGVAAGGAGGSSAAGGAGGSSARGGAGGGGPAAGGAAPAGGAGAGGGPGAVGSGGSPVIATGGVTGAGGTSSGGTTGMGGAVATGGAAAGGAGAGGAPGGGGAGGQGGGAAGQTGSSRTPVAIDCSAPRVPASGLLSDFDAPPPGPGRWASSNGLFGTVFAFAKDSSSTATATVGSAPSDLHLTASVAANSYAGGGFLFDSCVSTAGYTSLRFSVAGTNGCPIWLQVQTYNLKPDTDVPQGGCSSTCSSYPTYQNVPISPSPVTVPLASFSPWSSTLSSQVVAVYWFLDTVGGKSACSTDLHFDDVTLVP